MESIQKHSGWGLRHLWVVALLLIPSAWFLTRFPDLPRFGQLHDDGLYFVAAKSLAEGHGYRIESLPGSPAQTKYPPLYSALLAVAWKITPEFPRNLKPAAWISWLALPLVLLQLGWLFSRMGFSVARVGILLALFALNPYVLDFSTALMSELWFLAFTLGAMLLADRALEKRSLPWAVVAGLVAGLSYLTRSAGISLFAAGAIWFWLHKERKLAAAFLAAAVPFAVVWTLWVRANQSVTNDPELLYYVDYLRYRFFAISSSDWPVLLWKNLDGLLYGAGSLILPKITWTLFEKIAAQVLAVGAISGLVRMVRGGAASIAVLFTWFAGISMALLVVWHYPPNERFVLPVFPLLLAGLGTEATHLGGMLRAGLRHKKKDQRVAAVLLTGFVAIAGTAILGAQGYFGVVVIPTDAEQHRAQQQDRAPFYKWVRENVPAEASVLSGSDPLFYLHTGRHAMSRPLPPYLWYREDRPGQVKWMSEPAGFARAHRLQYFDFAGVDVSAGVEDEEIAQIARKIETSPDLMPLLRHGKATLYEIRPASVAEAARIAEPLAAR